MAILESVHSPDDIRDLTPPQSKELCEEIRAKVIETVSKTGGHLSSNLGVVELTVALHQVFHAPHDAIVWDVGHQCYVHKLLTGRADRFDTLRQTDGISGFPRPSESPYDTFIAGHSSTSISAANGIAKAKAMSGDDGFAVAVIGDGAMTGGLAYEGLVNAGRSHDRLIVILNDNRMSISQNVGFMARYLSSLRARPRYVQMKMGFGNLLSHIPVIGKPINRWLVRVKSHVKNKVYHNSSTFEEMGYYYLGPVDGHNLRDLKRAMETAKKLNRPVLLHVETIKGQGYRFAIEHPDQFHGVSGFNIETGELQKSGASFSKVAADCVLALAGEDPKLCVVTAAMTGGTGLSAFAEKYPKRCFDVGIAEEHAATFVSGIAAGGCLPVFFVYSTFLQRAYDQLLNDTAIMGNHVVLAIDRAGLVPDDGETHQGIFDVPFLSTIPGTTIYAPSTFEELSVCLKQAVYDDTGLVAVRYPKGGEFEKLDTYKPDYKPYTHFRNVWARTLIVTYGRLFSTVLQTVSELHENIPLSVLKLTRIRPLPDEVLTVVGEYQRVIFFEEGQKTGGVAEQLGARLMERQYWGKYEIHAIEGFVPNCSVEEGLHRAGLDTEGMIRAIRGDEPVDE